jgi:hypothetical protein
MFQIVSTTTMRVPLYLDTILSTPKGYVLNMRVAHNSYPGHVIPIPLVGYQYQDLMRILTHQRSIVPRYFDTMCQLLQDQGLDVVSVDLDVKTKEGILARLTVGDPEGTVLPSSGVEAIAIALCFACPMFTNEEFVRLYAYNPSKALIVDPNHADMFQAYHTIQKHHTDPTLEMQIKRAIAIENEDYESAQTYSKEITDTLYKDIRTQLLVAMTSAMEGGRFEEVRFYIRKYNEYTEES